VNDFYITTFTLVSASSITVKQIFYFMSIQNWIYFCGLGSLGHGKI